jgi:imidazole glycerol-phosphate synthase subunit HisH
LNGKKITLVDYGAGNIKAFAHIYQRLNYSVEIAQSSHQIMNAVRLILPGVGAFDWAMARLNDSGMRDALDERVLNHKTPVIGVCVGMQMMANSSEEGKLPGLGWIDAQVLKFKPVNNRATPLPHMGWNDIVAVNNSSLFQGIIDPRYYFLHSYVVEPANVRDTSATAEYGSSFTAAVECKNIFGTQFHPEKSHRWGIKLLQNFAEISIAAA